MISFPPIRNELDLRDRIRDSIARRGYATIPLRELQDARLATDAASLAHYARGLNLVPELGVTVVSYAPMQKKYVHEKAK